MADLVTSGDWSYERNSDGIHIWEYTGTEEILNVPATLEGIPVVTVGGFRSPTLKKIVLPESIKSLSQVAFSECYNLSEFDLPGVESANAAAFINCGVKDIILPKLKPTIKVSKSSVTLKKGKSYTVKVSKLANGDSVKKWTTKNKKIATVSKNGKITAKKKGSTYVYVYLKSGLKKSIKVKVK